MQKRRPLIELIGIEEFESLGMEPKKRRPLFDQFGNPFDYETDSNLALSYKQTEDNYTSSNEQRKLEEKRDLYKSDWTKWIEEWLHISCTPWPDDYPPDSWTKEQGYPLWTRQLEIVKAVQKHKKVAVRSAFDVGKTFVAALIALCICFIEKGLGITTAPTFRQVKRLLWAEIHKIYNKAESINKLNGISLGGQLNKTSLELDSGKWFIEGFSTDKEYNFQGFHEATFFLVGDEAGQLERGTYEAFEGILTNEDVYVLLIGNPIDPHNEFKNCFLPGSDYHQMQITSFESPNVKHKENLYPMLVSHDWPERMLKKWKSVDHPFYMSKVRAEFPKEGEDQLINWEFIQAALDRYEEMDEKSPVKTIGLDVARKGSDLTVYGSRQENGRYTIYRTTARERETETAGRMKLDLKGKGEVKCDMDKAPICANIDDIGVGGGVCDILYEEDYPINEIVVSEAPPEWEEDAELFLNKRAWNYWKLKKVFEEGDVGINDDDLAEELHAVQKDYTSGGKIKMKSKDEIRAKLGRSPDKADSMMLAWAEDEAGSSRDLVREV